MTHSTISYRANDKEYLGTLVPAQGAPKALAVLLPDWRGQSDLAFDHADHLAQLGCLVVIADLYGEGFCPDSAEQVGPMVQHLIAHRTEGVAALAACVDAVKANGPKGAPLVCVGYSAGGMVALDYGRSGADIAGIVLCSALLKTAVGGDAPHIRAPILVLQGTQDQVAPLDTIKAVIAEMDAAGNDARFVLFSQTHHAFDNPEAGSDPTARLVYSPSAAKQARAAIAEFVAEVSA